MGLRSKVLCRSALSLPAPCTASENRRCESKIVADRRRLTPLCIAIQPEVGAPVDATAALAHAAPDLCSNAPLRLALIVGSASVVAVLPPPHTHCCPTPLQTYGVGLLAVEPARRDRPRLGLSPAACAWGSGGAALAQRTAPEARALRWLTPSTAGAWHLPTLADLY